VVESGRRDGAAVATAVVVGGGLWSSSAVVVSPGGVGMVGAKEWHGRADSRVK
jgi:hypothetical protein